jgi:hypothetical protein
LKSLKSPFCWFVAFVSGGSFKPCFCITLLNSYLYLEITDFRNWMIHNIYNPDNPHFWLDFWIDLFISKPHTYIYIHIYTYIYISYIHWFQWNPQFPCSFELSWMAKKRPNFLIFLCSFHPHGNQDLDGVVEEVFKLLPRRMTSLGMS